MFRTFIASLAAHNNKPQSKARLLPLLNPNSPMSAGPSPAPFDPPDDPDEGLCADLDGCSLSYPSPPPASLPIGRHLSGQVLVERAWEHWNQLGAPKRVVAPMVDNSELPFRMLCRKYGAEAAYTPMLHSRIFNENEKYRSMEFTTCKVRHVSYIWNWVQDAVFMDVPDFFLFVFPSIFGKDSNII